MKKLLILFIATTTIIACKTGPERYSTSGTEVAMLKKLVDDYEKGNWEAWLSAYSDTAKVYHNTRTANVSGKEALDRHKQTTALMSSYEFMDKPIFYEKIIDDEGDTWVNFWGYWKGKLAANDQEIETPVHLSVQVADGKIVEEHGFWNTAPLADALREIEAKKAMMSEEETTEE